MIIRGSCHCGNIAFALTWSPEPTEIQARACTCSFCSKHGGVWTSKPDGNLAVTVRDAANVSHYSFATRTAQFHVCKSCGVVPVVSSEIDGHLYAVVNVNAFENVDRSMLKVSPALLDGEEKDVRLARRQRFWIADVSFGGSPTPAPAPDDRSPRTSPRQP